MERQAEVRGCAQSVIDVIGSAPNVHLARMKGAGEGALIVTLFLDSGERYLCHGF